MKPFVNVTVVESPITTRYCQPGSDSQLDTEKNQIRIGGAWFDYDPVRWKIITKEEKKYGTS